MRIIDLREKIHPVKNAISNGASGAGKDVDVKHSPRRKWFDSTHHKWKQVVAIVLIIVVSYYVGGFVLNFLRAGDLDPSGAPGSTMKTLQEIYDYVTTRTSNLDATVSSRAPSSTALTTATWTGTKAGYLDQANSKKSGGCPVEMAWVGHPGGGFCIDLYEAYNTVTTQAVDLNGDGDTTDAVLLGIEYVCEDGTADGTGDGTSAANCLGFNKAGSAYNQNPYVSITQAQAKASCLAAGKHLATSYEWYLAAQGTPDYESADPANDSEECNIWSNSKPSEATWVTTNEATKTGTAARCKSDYGVYDMIGNVWEWTADTAYWNMDYPVATSGTVYVKGREITGNQYIAGVDDYGIPNAWNAGAQSAFNEDYNWDGGVDGAYGISDIFSSGSGEGRPISGFLRGGTWSTGAAAGGFTLNLNDAPSAAGASFGFRCAQ